MTFEAKAWQSVLCLPADVRDRILTRLTYVVGRDDLRSRVPSGRPSAHEVTPGFVALLARSGEEIVVADLFRL